MARAVLVLNTDQVRKTARAWIDQAPAGSRLELKGPKRSLPQNDRMWAMLTDVSRQKHHFNLKLTPDDWKVIFTAALKRELRLVPNLTGDGVVQLGMSTSDMTTAEMTDLIEFMFAWGAENGVLWSDPKEQARAA